MAFSVFFAEHFNENYYNLFIQINDKAYHYAFKKKMGDQFCQLSEFFLNSNTMSDVTYLSMENAEYQHHQFRPVQLYDICEYSQLKGEIFCYSLRMIYSNFFHKTDLTIKNLKDEMNANETYAYLNKYSNFSNEYYAVSKTFGISPIFINKFSGQFQFFEICKVLCLVSKKISYTGQCHYTTFIYKVRYLQENKIIYLFSSRDQQQFVATISLTIKILNYFHVPMPFREKKFFLSIQFALVSFLFMKHLDLHKYFF